MSPSPNWLAEAIKPGAHPIFVYQITALDIYFANVGGHYPVDGKGEPHHPGIIDPGGLPKYERKIQNIFSGRSVTSFGSLKLTDDGTFDNRFGSHNSTLRGAKIYGYVTFAGLDWDADAELYLTGRVQKLTASDKAQLTLTIADATSEELSSTRLAEGTYTTQKLGDVVKARLVAAGLTYPDDFDATAWTAWIAAGKPGDYTVTGSWPEGYALDIVDGLIRETLTWYCIRRDGKFYIEQFEDLGGSPAVDVDLTDGASLFEGGNVSIYEPVFRQQNVVWDNGGTPATETKDVDPADIAEWLLTAKDGEPKDIGLTVQADATSLATSRLILLSSEHAFSKLLADTRMLAYNLGATVESALGDKRLPALAPVYHRVVEIIEDPNKGEIAIKVWTKLGGPALL